MLTEQDFYVHDAGCHGVEGLTDTLAHANGPYGKFIALADTVVAAIVSEFLSGNTLAGVTFPKGATIRIPGVTSITLTSGSLLAYKLPAAAVKP